MKTTDVVIIGGGIIGCAIGYYLAKKGMKVSIVERNDLASGTTRAGQGAVGSGTELLKKSANLYAALSDELGCDLKFTWKGGLNFILDEPDLKKATGEVKDVVRSGGDVKLLNRTQVREMEPAVADDVIAGVYTSDGGAVDAFQTTYGFARAMVRYGSQIYLHNEVKDIGVEKGQVTSIETENGTIKTKAVVLATGIWTPELGVKLGITVPVTPRRGHMLVTESTPPLASDLSVYNQYGVYSELRRLGKRASESDNPSVRQGVAWNLIRTGHDSYLVGTSRDFAGLNSAIRHDVTRSLAERTVRFFPSFQNVNCIRAYCGFRQYTPDIKPIIGPVDQVKGLYLATGFEGEGIMLAPIVGTLITELISEGTTSCPIHEYRLSRFS